MISFNLHISLLYIIYVSQDVIYPTPKLRVATRISEGWCHFFRTCHFCEHQEEEEFEPLDPKREVFEEPAFAPLGLAQRWKVAVFSHSQVDVCLA